MNGTLCSGTWLYRSAGSLCLKMEILSLVMHVTALNNVYLVLCVFKLPRVSFLLILFCDVDNKLQHLEWENENSFDSCLYAFHLSYRNHLKARR